MIDVTITDDNTGIIFTLSGEFSADEILSKIKELFNSDIFPNLKYWLIDRSLVTNYNLSNEQVQLLARLCIDASKTNSSLAHILVSKTDLEYGIANMFHVHVEKSGWLFKSFRERQEADEWIKVNLLSTNKVRL
ncbi:MAG: hypothetical protein DSY90_09875 [Deltaproteobacteria bacterium]|nr:MAG: hypothetical protein DSY90_09875 [Deltaproteobacteria bacterium]